MCFSTKVEDDEDKEIHHGKVCDDMWVLDLNKLSVSPRLLLDHEAGLCDRHITSHTHTHHSSLLQWDRVKKAGMAPGPRSSFSMFVHKSRALFFGGVSDHETKVSVCGVMYVVIKGI
jgi:hypothetical protein